jgi:hypothetical protein
MRVTSAAEYSSHAKPRGQSHSEDETSSIVTAQGIPHAAGTCGHEQEGHNMQVQRMQAPRTYAHAVEWWHTSLRILRPELGTLLAC